MTEWILPTNPKTYRTDEAFRNLGAVEWFQSRSIKNIQIGDIAYLYISTPVQELHWKCQVTDVNRAVSIIDDTAYYQYDTSGSTFEGPFIELKAIYEFPLPDLVSFQMLKQHGLKNRLMGPCRVNDELSQYLAEVDRRQNDANEIHTHLQTIPSDKLKKLAEDHSGKSISKKTTTEAYVRNPYIAQYVKRRANGKCQLCNQSAPFKDQFGEPYLESHHVVWLSNGGEDSIKNAVALCPNCHRKMHIVNDPDDVAMLIHIARNG